MAVRALVALDLSREWRNRLVEEFPDIAFTFVSDGAAFLAAASSAEVALAHSFPREAAAAATHLRWLQAGTSGVSHMLHHEFRERGVVVTNARPQGVPMAENVLAMMLAFAVRLPLFVESRARHEPVAQRAAREKFELQGQTLLVLGLGDVGGALSRRAAALGMRVLGLRRRPDLPCPGASLVVGVDRLAEVLPQAHHVTNTLPLTQGTRHFLGRPEFGLMRPGAYLYNVGGGATLEREALLEALRSGRLAGAGLDVTDPDPLPPEDPLWGMDNVILTQHTGGASARNSDRIVAIFATNLKRYIEGQPLLHVVDQELGSEVDDEVGA